jgi:hypothetical protein
MAMAEDAVPLNVGDEIDANGLKISRDSKAKSRLLSTTGTRANAPHTHRGYDALDTQSQHEPETGEYLLPDSPSAFDYVMHPLRSKFLG